MKQESERMFMIWSHCHCLIKYLLTRFLYIFQNIPLKKSHYLDYERTFHNAKKPHTRLHFE